MIIKHVDMTSLDYCNRGAREFCLRHGINWQVFIQTGIDSSEVEHIDDAMLQAVIANAKCRENREKQ